MSKLYRARSLLYRRQILQVNIRWKALDEIYKIYMLLHRSDLNISENFQKIFKKNFQKIFGNFGAAGDFFADRCEKFSTLGGAKAGGAGRSGQMLPVAYLLAKFGLYPDENEPRKSGRFSQIFGIDRLPDCQIARLPDWQFENFQNL